MRLAADPDHTLRLFERDAAIACGAMAVIAVALGRGRPDGAAGVLAGGALMALSYWAIKGGVDLVVGLSSRAGRLRSAPATFEAAGRTPSAAEDSGPPEDVGGTGHQSCPDGVPPQPVEGGTVLGTRRRAGLAVKFFTRYALLAVGAYVMLTCFRVHPVGLVAGATTPFVAALAQAVRAFRAPSHREHP